jgi:tetratricopeptide (TPR) repeat protein
MAKSWSSQDLGYLKRYAATKTLEELAQRFEVDAADVRAQLAAHDLVTKDGEPQARVRIEEAVLSAFESGVEALYKGNWKTAIKQFEKVLDDGDPPELAARARQHMAVAERRLGDGDGTEANHYLVAVCEKNRGALDEAMKIVKAQAKDDGGRFAYLAASLHALKEDEAAAVQALEKAVAADPLHKVSAYHDPDFTELRKNKDHAHLFGLA